MTRSSEEELDGAVSCQHRVADYQEEETLEGATTVLDEGCGCWRGVCVRV